MLIAAFDPLFDPKVTGSLGLSQYPSSSECSALTHFSISLVHKYVNLKEPYNQGIKEQVTNKNFWKRRQALHEISNPKAYFAEGVLKS